MNSITLSDVAFYVERLPPEERAKVWTSIKALERLAFEKIEVRSLRGDIKELKVGPHRIFFFWVGDTVYLVSAFRKKSRKAPAREIDRAEAILHAVTRARRVRSNLP